VTDDIDSLADTLALSRAERPDSVASLGRCPNRFPV